MINSNFTNILGVVLLIFGVVIWELFDDRKGDLNKKEDVFYRGALMLLAACLNTLLNGIGNCEDWRRALFFLVLSFNLSVSSFFLLFDYLITYILIKGGVIELGKNSPVTWFNYRMGGGFEFWKKASPMARLFIRVGYFVISLVIYLVWA